MPGRPNKRAEMYALSQEKNAYTPQYIISLTYISQCICILLKKLLRNSFSMNSTRCSPRQGPDQHRGTVNPLSSSARHTQWPYSSGTAQDPSALDSHPVTALPAYGLQLSRRNHPRQWTVGGSSPVKVIVNVWKKAANKETTRGNGELWDVLHNCPLTWRNLEQCPAL